jgi:hypothetical protein
MIIRTQVITLATVEAESESAARQCYIDGDYETVITTTSSHLTRIEFVSPNEGQSES